MSENSYINITDKSMCSGCRACEHSCPFSAISMAKDNEGFIYPDVDLSKCTNCGICTETCPVTKFREKNLPKTVYTAQLLDKKLLSQSSSGGVFAPLAKYVIDNGGYVFGCVFDENYNAIIKKATTMDEVYPMQGSKYVSSDTSDTFAEARELLKKGDLVLYTATPCQIAGLKAYLKKDYDNLITMDFLCHGVTSADLFSENISYLESKYGGKITDYKFRDKSKRGWAICTGFKSNGKKYYELFKENLYFCGFISGSASRYSCYSCHFRGENKKSDITVGDFWGCSDTDIDTSKGVSFIAINTEIGYNVINNIKSEFYMSETTAEEVAKQNSSMLHDTPEKIPQFRKNIYGELKRLGYAKCADKYFKPKNYALIKLKNRMPKFLLEFAKKIRGLK